MEIKSDYIILTDKTSDGLAEKVNEHIGKGYSLISGPIIAMAGNFCQAMIKKD